MIAKFALLFACVALASGNPAAGKAWRWKSPQPLLTPIGPVKSPRIVGGQEAVEHSYPHQAALFIDDTYFCGGSLISNQWVLTAGHCLDGARSVEVVLGAHNIRVAESTQVTLTSTDLTVHENYGSILIRNDIALVKLPSSVTFTSAIQPVGLPSSDIGVGTVATPTGWGLRSDSAISISNVLREVDVPVISNSACDLVYGVITSGNICTSGADGKGTCSGDSGGPLNYNGNTYGITSFGAADGCELGYPSAFTRVTEFLDWIQTHTGVTP